MTDKSGEGDSSARTTKPIRLWHIGLWVVFASLAIGLLICLFTFILRGSMIPWGLEKPLQTAELQQVVQSAVTSAAALGLGVTLYLSFRRQKSADDSFMTTLELLRLQQDQHKSDSITRLRDRYVSAAEQLGSESRPIRLAGIYALASLADDWSDEPNYKERQVCIDLLTSYLAIGPNEKSLIATSGPEWETIWSSIFERVAIGRASNGWPKAAVRIRNVILANELEKLELDFGTLNFTASPVSRMSFNECHFASTRVLFDEAQDRGSLFFQNCRFSGGAITLDLGFLTDGKKDWSVIFYNCFFEGTQLDLNGSTATGGYTFMYCKFQGDSPSFTGSPDIALLQFVACRFFMDPLTQIEKSGISNIRFEDEKDDGEDMASMADRHSKPMAQGSTNLESD